MSRHRSWFFTGVLLAAFVLPQSAGASITGIPEINPHPSFPGPQPAAPTAVSPGRVAFSPFAPVTGVSWSGISDSTVAPPDPNGAIGPSNYLEIINLQLGIYNRSGTLISKTALGTLTGVSQFHLSDPMVLWDSTTRRFYFNVWNTTNATMDFGFSKTSTPATASDFCHYVAHFGYTTSDVPDYPKLGQSKNFLLIGVNHYAGFSAPSSDRSDLLWITKPQTVGAITTCPAATTFGAGRFTGLKNANGSQAFTPVPTIEDDTNTSNFVVASNDIECPPKCGSGTLITVYVVSPSSTNPAVPAIVATHSLTVPTYSSPAGPAPQFGTLNTLDTLDGRLEHAVAAVDPRIGKEAIWTGHTIAGSGGRTIFRWYEIAPTPFSSPSVVQTGTVSSSSLWVFNGAMAPDRTVNSSGSAHGSDVVIGFTTSSSTTFPADRMVSQIGTGTPSGFVLVHQSSTFDSDFTCRPKCRWGDYGGATSDPAASLTASAGQVWLTNEAVTATHTNGTWNWEATP